MLPRAHPYLHLESKFRIYGAIPLLCHASVYVIKNRDNFTFLSKVKLVHMNVEVVTSVGTQSQALDLEWQPMDKIR
jgi:hypothetical protein